MLAAEARDEAHATVCNELLQLSQSYLRLARQADRNNLLEISYEAPLSAADRHATG
jgi:hypothetical protein